MKYLFTVLAIVISVSIITFFFLWPQTETVEDADILVTVNGHTIPRSVLDLKKSRSGYHSKDDRAIIDNIIINELLLQEAQRQGIDQEPSFRLAVQDYYEQSLIKILIDRQFSETEKKATDEEIDNYIKNYGKLFIFTRLPEKGSAQASDTAEQKTVLFDDLSESLKLMLGSLKEGEIVTDFYTGSEVVSFRLDKIEPGPDQEPFTGSREMIGRIITNYKKEQALTNWIKELRDKATITTPETAE